MEPPSRPVSGEFPESNPLTGSSDVVDREKQHRGQTHAPLRFAALTLGIACALAAIAWLTELRAIFHGGLIALCVFAFLPFVVIACVLGAMLIFGVVLGIATDGDVHASALAGYSESLLFAKRGIQVYYSFLARKARSTWLGIPAGVLLGSLFVWLLLAILVIPHELKTTALLLSARTEIDQYYKAHHKYPDALNDLSLSVRGSILDGFGRPLNYETRGKWLTKSYRITSYGFDGVPSSDDLCVEGKTKLQKLLDSSATLISLGQAVISFKTGVPVQSRMNALYAVQCEQGSVEPNAE